jgi:hypothetical protein
MSCLSPAKTLSSSSSSSTSTSTTSSSSSSSRIWLHGKLWPSQATSSLTHHCRCGLGWSSTIFLCTTLCSDRNFNLLRSCTCFPGGHAVAAQQPAAHPIAQIACICHASPIHLVILATIPLSKGSLQRSCVSALEHLSSSFVSAMLCR